MSEHELRELKTLLEKINVNLDSIHWQLDTYLANVSEVVGRMESSLDKITEATKHEG